jgi:hypothetical protein
MLDNIQSVLQSGIGQPLTVNLLDGSTGKTGALDRVGADYLAIFDAHSMYLIPFNAIATIVSPAQALS